MTGSARLLGSRSVKPWVPVLIGAGLLLTACSSSSSEGSPGPSASSSAPAATKSTLVIGVPAGVSAFDGSGKFTAAVAEAWGKKINATGGLAGHPVKVLVVDTGNFNAAKSQSVVKKLVEQDKVVAIVGHMDGGSAAWEAYSTQQGVPVIGGGVGAGVKPVANVFPTAQQAAAYFGAIPAVAHSLGIKNFSEIGCTEAPGCGGEPLIKAALKNYPELSFKGVTLVSGTQPTYTAACLQVKSKDVGFTQLTIGGTTAKTLIPNCATQKVSPVWGMATYAFDAGLEKLPGTMSALARSFPWWLDTPAAKEFRDTMDTYAPGKDYKSLASTQTWQAFKLFEKAIAAVTSEDPTRADIMTAMTNIKDEDLDGLLPSKQSFSATALPTGINCGFLMQIKDGKEVLPKDTEAVCLDQ